MEDGKELVTKAPGKVEGEWEQEGDRLTLRRESGQRTIGFTNTMSFSFQDDQLEALISEEGLVLEEGENQVVLKPFP